MKKWKQLSSEIILDTPRFKVRKDVVELPNSEKKDWVFWDSKDSSMVVGMTDDQKLVMIRQYRYLVADEVIEFASGGFEKHENSMDAAKREFKEETGYKCDQLIKLGSFYETYGQLNRQIHMFFAPQVTRLDHQNLDRGKRGYEDIQVELVGFDQAVSYALENKIVAMGSALAILLLKTKINQGEISI